MPELTAADLLAGPIVRRVDTQRVCVWVALAQPAQVSLQLFAGGGARGILGAPLPAAPTADGSFENRTLAIGARLHIALAVFEPLAPARLDWGALYSYDLRFKTVFTTGDGDLGLGELGLLVDQPALPGLDGTTHPHLALGYDADVLPSFVLPPQDPRALRIAHGSCRAHGADQRDAMALVDDLIADARLDSSRRLHQLLLTGDQVYADSVSPEMLRVLAPIANRLTGGDPTEAIERIPIDLVLDPTRPEARSVEDVPVDMFHLPAGRRAHVMNDLGGGSSTEADSHMLGFGEIAALYLTAWSPTCWPDLHPRLAERWQQVTAYRTTTQGLQQAARERLGPEVLAGKPWDEHGGDLRERLAIYHAWLLLPAEMRAIDVYLSPADRQAEWLPADDPAPHAAGRPFKWTNFWSAHDGHPEEAIYLEPPRDFGSAAAAPAPDMLKSALARALTPSWYAGRHAWGCDISYDSLQDATQPDRVLHDAGRSQLGRMQVFLDDLPRVRRAMANVSIMMMFDDHEVSDDWNISANWARRTYGSSLGRAQVRNMLGGYALFQHWGNDPEAFRDPARPGHQLLTLLTRQFFDEAPSGPPVLRSAGPPVAIRDALDRLLDLRRPDAAPTPSAERMLWHWRYEGAQHELIALDSRTWRGFEVESDTEIGQPASDQASTALINAESLPMQLSDAPAPGSVLTLVITSAPFIGMPVAENIVQPALNASGMPPLKASPPFVARQRASRPGRLAKDPEPFGFVPRVFEAILARLANRKRVVFLSGDVHYSLMLEMTYWRFGSQPLAARFVQLVSSSLRAPRGQGDMELFTMDLLQQLGGVTSQQSRLGWVQPVTGAPPILPGSADALSFRIRRLLTEDPVMLPADGLPAGTATTPVQWAWRMAQVSDVRPDSERTVGLDAPRVNGSVATEPARAAVELARRHRWQSEHMQPRRWQWWTNLCTVDFVDDGGGIVVRQHVYARDVDGGARRPVARMLTETSLEVGTAAPPAPGAG